VSYQNIWEIVDERFSRRQRRRAETTALLLESKQDDLVLDVGCGDGFVTSYLTDCGFIVGVDLNLDALRFAKAKVNKPNAGFVLCTLTNLPFKESVFNKVAILEVFEHLPLASQKLLANEADRVATSGGTLIISVPYKESIEYTRCVHCGKLTPLWGHLHTMDERKVADLLSSHYVLMVKLTLANVGFISLSSVFSHLQFRIWLLLNNLLGKIHKGYWLLLKYQKQVN
jgi:ubiquinone/menaquinone biosynthesis C-methylase UbiE